MRYKNDPSARLGVIELFAGAAGLAQISLRSDRCEILALPSIQKAAKQSFQKCYLTRSKNSKCDKNSPIGVRYVHLLKKLCSSFLLMENVLQLFYRKQFTNLQYSQGQRCDKDYTILNLVQLAATNDSSPSVFCNSMSIKL